jgi:hypothetical protein
MLNSKHDADSAMSAPPAEPPVAGGDKPPVAGGEKPAEAKESSEPPAEEEAEEEKKPKEKTEKSMTETRTDIMPLESKEKADSPTGHTPNPSGSGSPIVGGDKNPDLKPDPTEKPVPGDSKPGIGDKDAQGKAQGSPIKKDEIPQVVKRPAGGDVLKMMKDKGYVVFKVDTRAEAEKKEKFTDFPVKKETPEPQKNGVCAMLRSTPNPALMRLGKEKMKEGGN